MKRKLWIAILSVIILAVGAVLLLLLRMGYLLPTWISWEAKTISGTPVITLKNRAVTVTVGDETIWKTDRTIPVQDVLWDDIDHDAEPELMLLCWKRGRYGDSRPFWVEKDDPVWTQHIFLYDWIDGEIQPIWMASDLGMDVAEWSFSDHTRLLLTERNGTQSAWDWQSWGLSRVEATSLSFAAVGDLLIHRSIYDHGFRRHDGNFDHLFAEIQGELKQYDVTSIHQETIYVDDPGDYSDYPRFGTPIEVGQVVVNAGFDIISCASNHALDKGMESIDLTADLYEAAGVLYAGIQSSENMEYRPYEIFDRNGIRCAVFSYTQSTNGLLVPEDAPFAVHTLFDEEQVRVDLQASREQADLVLVYVHWGTEYADTPDEFQHYWAQVFADCGADVVIGTHPHVLQPMEWVTGVSGNQTLVYYSLGNFISAQTEEACTKGGLAYFSVVKENGSCRVIDHGLKQLTTTHESGHYTTTITD